MFVFSEDRPQNYVHFIRFIKKDKPIEERIIYRNVRLTLPQTISVTFLPQTICRDEISYPDGKGHSVLTNNKKALSCNRAFLLFQYRITAGSC